jgi:aspartate 4-decarboxylase
MSNEYDNISPFKIKDLLIEKAYKTKGKIIDAGRGNPNFLNTVVREALGVITLFATQLSKESSKKKDIGFVISKKDITKKFRNFLHELDSKDYKDAKKFWLDALDYLFEKVNVNLNRFVYELSKNALGSNYPYPTRMDPVTGKLIKKYMSQVFNLGDNLESYSIFGTEGASAGIVYVFKSLKENFILKENDKIAIATPIYVPYLELPELVNYHFDVVKIPVTEENKRQISHTDLEKLKNPDIKAFFIVNPSNPTSVALTDASLKMLGDFVRKERKDLIIITDTPYANFIKNFRTISSELPYNTIEIYSYSKYFGATGWRAGIVLVNKNNVVDTLIRKMPTEIKLEYKKRYLTANPNKYVKFIDRMIMDSRDIALSHTAGISGPQRTFIAIASLYDLMDEKKEYQQSIINLITERWLALYKGLGIPTEDLSNYSKYYAVVDIEKIMEQKFGKDFREYFTKNYTYLDYLIKLAEDYKTICLPGDGFGANPWEFRVSLSNIYADDARQIGTNIVKCLKDFHEKWKN